MHSNLEQMRFRTPPRLRYLLLIAIAEIPGGFCMESDTVSLSPQCARVAIRLKNSRFNFHLRQIS